MFAMMQVLSYRATMGATALKLFDVGFLFTSGIDDSLLASFCQLGSKGFSFLIYIAWQVLAKPCFISLLAYASEPYPFPSQCFREEVVHAVPFQVTMFVYLSCWHISIVVVHKTA